MSETYCPECGAQSEATAVNCRECKFPLELRVTLDGQGVHIAGQAEHWKRIAQLLKRGGVRIQTSDHVQNRLVWWSLPIAGALVLVMSLLFGGSIANAIWTPPPPARAVLDLNDPNPKPATQQEENDPTLTFLTDVLKSSPEQEEAANSDLDLTQFVDKEPLSTSEIAARAKQALAVITVGKRKARATIISPEGHVIVAQKSLQGAFARTIRSFMEKGKVVEREVVTMPQLSTIDGATSTGELATEDEVIGIGLLRTQLKQRLDYNADFDAGIEAREQLWIAKDTDGTIVLEKSEAVAQVPFSEDVYYWVLSTKLPASYAGAPVFNRYGELVGVLMDHNDETAVMSLLTLRERAPLIYKNIH